MAQKNFGENPDGAGPRQSPAGGSSHDAASRRSVLLTVGPPVDVTILRVNNEEYILGLHWSERRFWRAPPGQVRINSFARMVYKTGFGRSAGSEAKLMAVKYEPGGMFAG